MIITNSQASLKRTIPLAVRAALGIKPSDEIAYAIADGRVLWTKATGLVPALRFEDPFAFFGEWDTPEDDEAFRDLQRTGRAIAPWDSVRVDFPFRGPRRDATPVNQRIKPAGYSLEPRGISWRRWLRRARCSSTTIAAGQFHRCAVHIVACPPCGSALRYSRADRKPRRGARFGKLPSPMGRRPGRRDADLRRHAGSPASAATACPTRSTNPWTSRRSGPTIADGSILPAEPVERRALETRAAGRRQPR